MSGRFDSLEKGAMLDIYQEGKCQDIRFGTVPKQPIRNSVKSKLRPLLPVGRRDSLDADI